jgi:nucleoside-diphosphate-sugar epimerase
VLVTGGSGFLGRHLVEALRREHDVVGLSRMPPARRGYAPPPGVGWLLADVGDEASLAAAVAELRQAPPVDVVFHLAAHYDLTGERHPEYERTNVVGTRHVLDAAAALGARDVIFASSLAACRFPRAGETLDEDSPADGDTPYAESKRAGEEAVRGRANGCRGFVVRFAALFSDWCEYEPLYRQLETWFSRQWRRRVLGGRGASAVPYLHVDDAVAFLARLLARRRDVDPAPVLIASGDGATSHRELFAAATAAVSGAPLRPLLVPRPLCRLGLPLLALAGAATGAPAFERPWMGRYIDLALRVDARRSRERLAFEPRPQLAILERLPRLLRNRAATPLDWLRLNEVARLRGSALPRAG